VLPVPLYLALMGLCCGYAFVRGGRPERIGAAIIVIGTFLSMAALSAPLGRYRTVESGILGVDLIALVAFTALALRADRFWPIWVSALAGMTILGHVGRWYLGPDIGRGAYAIGMVLWSYPILVVIAIGTFNHQRRTAGHPGGLAADR